MSLMETLSSTMETVEDGSNTGGGAKKLALTRPKLTLHPRNATEAFLRGSDAATPSPMTFVASLFADQDPYTGDQKSFSQLLAGAMASPNATISAQNDSTTSITLPSLAESSTPLGGGGPCSDGLPPRANTARFKSMMPPRLPIPRSPYLLIPPGFSPSTILESPVLLSTSLAEPSPTTGTFRPPFTQDSVLTAGPNVPGNFKDWNFGQDGNIASIFKPYPQLPNSPLASMGPYGLSHQQALAHVQAQASSQLMFDVAGPVASACDTTSNMPSTAVDTFVETNVSSQSLSLCEPKKETELELSEKVSSVSQSIGSGHPPTHFIERPAEDGYNWRKYGQKQVKGSEYPRSYYKCTHPNCPVKKKVERSYDGQITEYVYKGEHSHAKPQSTRRHHAINIAHVSDGSMKEGSFLPTLDRANFPSGMSRADRTQPAGRLTGTPEASLASTSDDEEGRDDESDPKRLKHERGTEPISNPPLRTIREPRVVVQTTSEVDILDDGYRWRKYGQKVVKGNPYPRSYYKCTSNGCTVRKHVERSSTDSKSVITTYEGKHNHDVPMGRSSHHEINPSMAGSISDRQPKSNNWGSNFEGRGATSLQEQLFGKLLEVADMETNNVIHRPSVYNKDNLPVINGSLPTKFSTMDSSHSRQGECYGHGTAGVMPKEEPEESPFSG